jgi:hypothetical protein
LGKQNWKKIKKLEKALKKSKNSSEHEKITKKPTNCSQLSPKFINA